MHIRIMSMWRKLRICATSGLVYFSKQLPSLTIQGRQNNQLSASVTKSSGSLLKPLASSSFRVIVSVKVMFTWHECPFPSLIYFSIHLSPLKIKTMGWRKYVEFKRGWNYPLPWTICIFKMGQWQAVCKLRIESMVGKLWNKSNHSLVCSPTCYRRW